MLSITSITEQDQSMSQRADGTEFGGQTCLVTGAARGLGRATAEHLLQRGATVLICDNDLDAAKAATSELSGLGAVHAFEVDVADPESIAALAKQILSRFDVSVLVNNAGYYSGMPVAEISSAIWDRVLNINLKSVFFMSQAFMPAMMAKRYGRIVNIASLDAYVPKSGNCHYAAAKAGVVSLTKTFAQEGAPQGILVNGVSPGPIATETAKSQGWLEKRRPLMPIGRVAEPREIADIVAFLASPRNTFIVGETVVASGGLVMV
jgi:3-oxoacyl-[acyl-carrier protein] reductase